jgi:phage gpG-like protein
LWSLPAAIKTPFASIASAAEKKASTTAGMPQLIRAFNSTLSQEFWSSFRVKCTPDWVKRSLKSVWRSRAGATAAAEYLVFFGLPNWLAYHQRT